MRTLTAGNSIIPIGKQGENLAVQVLFPVVAEWKALYGEGVFHLLYRRPDDPGPYVCEITTDEEKVTWDITSTEVAVVGMGRCELQYYVNNALAKSVTYITKVEASVDGGGNPPKPWESWVEGVLHAADEAVQAAEDAEAAKNTAVEAKDIAVDSKNTAVEAKNTAVEAKNTAVEAKDAAEAAKNAAVEAKDIAVDSKNTAVEAKNTAVEAKDAAEAAKEAAQSAANSASGSADYAERQAGYAKASEEAAEEYVTMASVYSSDAQGAAEAANDSKVAAQTAAQQAQKMIGTFETFNFAIGDWQALGINYRPYRSYAVKTAQTTIEANTIVELMNNNPVAFAQYGFAIGAVNGQNITFYSTSNTGFEFNGIEVRIYGC